MKYTELKAEKQKKYSELFDKVGIFFAFGLKQFEEGKKEYPLRPNEKYVDIGAGGFIRKNDLNTYLEGSKEINEWFKEENKKIKNNKKEKEKAILCELNNYEAFYSGDITDAYEVLEYQGYSRQEVLEVYKKHSARLSE